MRSAGLLAGVVAGLLLAGCSDAGAGESGAAEEQLAEVGSPEMKPPSESATERPEEAERPAPAPPDPEPRRSHLSIPAIGLDRVPVIRYRGTPDDGPGTRIQNGGPTASPRGPGGGVGPGQVGNFIVTGHRTSDSAPFRDLPALQVGQRVRVRSAGTTYVYRITTTRSTSFRSKRSLARQSAAVPGRPGVEPARAMITLSTCATAEDHAVGNYWSDRFGNPEHRIDKVGVLVSPRPAG
ncbi:class E sortase [Nocardioides pacificus]